MRRDRHLGGRVAMAIPSMKMKISLFAVCADFGCRNQP